jgi:outer membrane protein with beta-barrel domain
LNLTSRAATITTLLLVVLCGSPRETRADYLFMPFIGGAFARQTVFNTGVEQGEDSTHVIFGGSVSWLSSGILGVEGDFAYAPRFFESENPLDILGSNLLTLSGNVIAAVPLSVSEYSLRPYAIGGIGLIHSGISYLLQPAVDDNSLGFNVGGGAIGFLTRRTGVRFELRHFRTFEREPSEFGDVGPRVGFWRFTVGVVIRR